MRASMSKRDGPFNGRANGALNDPLFSKVGFSGLVFHL